MLVLNHGVCGGNLMFHNATVLSAARVHLPLEAGPIGQTCHIIAGSIPYIVKLTQ